MFKFNHYARALIYTIVLMLSSQALAAESQPAYNRVDLNAAAEQQVDNDEMVLTMQAFAENKEAKQVKREINQAMNWALDKLKPMPQIVVKTDQYRIDPVYKTSVSGSFISKETRREIDGWKGYQTLTMRSKDIATLADLAGELGNRLQMKGQYYQISFEKKQQVENELLKAAIDNLKTRAEIVQTSFNASNYRLVNMRVNSNFPRPVYAARAMMMDAVAYEKSAPVAASAGDSKVSMNISAQIELIK